MSASFPSPVKLTKHSMTISVVNSGLQRIPGLASMGLTGHFQRMRRPRLCMVSHGMHQVLWAIELPERIPCLPEQLLHCPSFKKAFYHVLLQSELVMVRMLPRGYRHWLTFTLAPKCSRKDQLLQNRYRKVLKKKLVLPMTNYCLMLCQGQ